MTSPTIYQLPTPLAGSVGILPQQKYMVVGDNLATITTAGYLNSINLESYTVSTNDILNVLYSYNPVTQVGTFEQFSISISGGTITLVALSNAGEVTLPTIANHIATYTNVSGHLSEDPATAISGGNIQAGLSGTAGTLASFPTTAARGSLVVKAVANTGDTLTTISNAAMGQASVVSIPDPGAATANFLISASAAGQSIASTTASPTPGTIRAVTGVMTGSAGTMTTGNLVGLRGEVDVVSASGGFLYGTQGKIIPTGTLSGSVWAAGLFGQLNVSAATINAGQVATVWGDWGATGATATNMTGARGFAFTNTTSNILNAQFYMYGPATNLLELDDNAAGYGVTYFKAAGTSAGSAGDTSKCNATKVLEISVNGTAYYIPLFAQNS